MEGTFGHTQETLHGLFDGVPDAVRQRITIDTFLEPADIAAARAHWRAIAEAVRDGDAARAAALCREAAEAAARYIAEQPEDLLGWSGSPPGR
jgi:DNA-binding GntR family transcriptional regulator